jgi:tRNA(His) guanylyltransferase
MKFDDFDRQMRIYETSHDHSVLPNIYMVARLDGRGFTKLTKEYINFEAPFDSQFRDYMTETVKHLMECGFNVIYGYTQSDEISLLLHRDDITFSRKLRKLNSVLAGEASAKFSLLLGQMGTFDCRICQLPTKELVIDYFSWRQQDAHRNALNAHCYWMLRKEGQSASKATEALSGLSVSDKNELLFSRDINFNTLPNWQKRGTGLYWEVYDKEGYNPLTEETVMVNRRRIKIDFELTMKDEYNSFIESMLEESDPI